jgi:Na+/H+ antiporter NhaD/arsenite permease-like protein
MKKILIFTLLLFVISSYAGSDLRAYQNDVQVQNVTQVGESHSESSIPPIFMIIPFVLLLAMIATGPLFYAHFWEKNYPKVAIFLGLIVVVYYMAIMNNFEILKHTLAEYLSFIALLGSLFVASGGILLRVDKKATPFLNVVILFIGAVIANIIGTTGASMLLIRPYMNLNKGRLKPYHVIFFIFIVSNIGGVLTPIGDPPLFLGYLRGINFFWFLQHGWYIWLPTVLAILAIFYFIDLRNKDTGEKNNFTGKIEFRGIKNVGFLLIVLVSVFLDPSVFSWVPSLSPLPIGIREIIMFIVMFAAYRLADKENLSANEFTFDPIKEVAFLFVGIFATMIPALQLIAFEAGKLKDGVTPGLMYWSSGGLSSILDNAPTFLNFLSAEMGRFGMDVNSKVDVQTLVNAHPVYLQAISVACVFFGAVTYIGNGPNFMVKSIAESSGLKMPSFFGYIVKYSLPVLIPLFFIIWLILFRG